LKIFDEDFKQFKKINLIILALTVAFVPLIVRFHLLELNDTISQYWFNPINSDFFSFYKMIWLLFMSAILCITLLAYLWKHKFIRTFFYIPLLLYAGFAVFSSIFSDYSEAVLIGFPDRFENIFVLLGYVILTIAAINLVDNKNSFQFISGALFISAFILGIHGLMQFFGFEFLDTTLGRFLTIPSEVRGFVEPSFRYTSGRIYSTMYNPNYVGSYGAMVVTFILGLYINSRSRKSLYIFGPLSVIMFAYLLGSQSRAGMVGFMVGILLLGFWLRLRIIRNWRSVGIIVIAFFLVFVSMNVYTIDDMLGEIISPATEHDLIEKEIALPPLTDIQSDDSRLTLETAAVELNLVADEEGDLIFLDGQDKELEYYIEEETGILNFVDEGFTEHNFRISQEEGLIEWTYDDRETYFALRDGKFYIAGINNNLYEIQDVPTWGFEGYERIGSGRGYIWSRSIPLLRETLIIGHGPDTYAMYFPHEDAAGMRIHMSRIGIVDKPHNMYLQKAINTGVLSLIALLVLWGGYLLQSLIIYKNANLDDWRVRGGIAVAAAVAAYLATGFFNDSVVSVAPVFWILLGMGISLNIQYRKSRE